MSLIYLFFKHSTDMGAELSYKEEQGYIMSCISLTVWICMMCPRSKRRLCLKEECYQAVIPKSLKAAIFSPGLSISSL